MTQRKAKDLRIGQLVKLTGGEIRWAEVVRQERAGVGIVTWVQVVDGPEEDLKGAETTIDGSETFHGIGWYCVSSLNKF